MHKSTLAVHEVELVVDSGEDFSNCRGVADHAASTHHLCQVATRYHSGRLIIDATLEAGRGPIYELDCPLCLDCCHARVDVLRDHITTVHHAARHVFAMA